MTGQRLVVVPHTRFATARQVGRPRPGPGSLSGTRPAFPSRAVPVEPPHGWLHEISPKLQNARTARPCRGFPIRYLAPWGTGAVREARAVAQSAITDVITPFPATSTTSKQLPNTRFCASPCLPGVPGVYPDITTS